MVPERFEVVLSLSKSAEVLLNKNVKVIASLVRKAKKKLLQDKREEALELMRKAVNVDDNNGVLIQVIQAIGRKTLITESQDQPLAAQEAPVAERIEPELLVTPEVPAAEQAKEEPVELLDEAWIVEEQPEEKPEPEAEAMENNQERMPSMPSEDQLNKLFEASDREYDNGNQQKAIAYLKRAGKLDPSNPEIRLKIDLLKIKIKSANLVQIARKRLALGEATRAVALARQAFDLNPDSAGLDDLLSKLEDLPDVSSSTPEVSEPRETRSGASAEYIARIRQLVQDNALEKAASVAAEAFIFFPDDDLIVEFVGNFKKLGLLE
jgi:tetratricopeptide (TPR) repeat protein